MNNSLLNTQSLFFLRHLSPPVFQKLGKSSARVPVSASILSQESVATCDIQGQASKYPDPSLKKSALNISYGIWKVKKNFTSAADLCNLIAISNC